MKWHYLPELPDKTCSCIIETKEGIKTHRSYGDFNNEKKINIHRCLTYANYFPGKSQENFVIYNYHECYGSDYPEICIPNDLVVKWCTFEEIISSLNEKETTNE